MIVIIPLVFVTEASITIFNILHRLESIKTSVSRHVGMGTNNRQGKSFKKDILLVGFSFLIREFNWIFTSCMRHGHSASGSSCSFSGDFCVLATSPTSGTAHWKFWTIQICLHAKFGNLNLMLDYLSLLPSVLLLATWRRLVVCKTWFYLLKFKCVKI